MVRSLINSALRVFNPLLELVYPTYCAGCGGHGDVFCPACAQSLVRVDAAVSCPVCGRTVGTASVCGDCTMHKKPFEQGFFGFSYEGPLREAMHAFKFQGRKDAGRTLVRMLKDAVAPLGGLIDVIVPLPVTERRLKERGFNQSYIIGEEIARMTGKPLIYSVLRKVRETRDQYTLSKNERKRNIRGAFAVVHGQRDISRKSVLLVDDLYTTGNTAAEAARTLRRAKARSVALFALARTP